MIFLLKEQHVLQEKHLLTTFRQFAALFYYVNANLFIYLFFTIIYIYMCDSNECCYLI